MAHLFGTNSQHGVPVTLEFSFNGASTPWGTANLYSMAPLSNRAEAIDGGYEISNLSVELIDTDGSIWGSLGHGTTAFNKEFSATVYIGGSMANASYGPSGLSRLQLANRTESATFTVHQGKITDVSKRNRKVKITSQNNLRDIGQLEWRFPYTDYMLAGANYSGMAPAVVGTYLFYPANMVSLFPNSVSGLNETGDAFDTYAAIATTYVGGVLSTRYPSIANRGTLGLHRTGGTQYSYPGTQFYSDYPIVHYKGSWIGTFIGTIDGLVEAQRYGYTSQAEAETARTGTRYLINKTRMHVASGTLPVGSWLSLQQNLTLEETPANLFRELVTGHCVTPYWGTTQIDQLTFGTSQRHTAYQTFSQHIAPVGGKVMPYLKDLFNSTYGLFSVNTLNKFEYRAYGPRNLAVTIGTINGTTLVDSSFSNSIEDAKNRVTLQYGYSPVSGEFSKTIEVKGSAWSGTTDNPTEIKSKWLHNDNEASVFANRVSQRFSRTAPKISLTVSLAHAGVELGSLFNVIDEDSGMNNKTLEIVGYSKDLTEGKQIEFTCIDGDAVYLRKGFGHWGPASVIPGGAVTGTSTLGWGTAGTMSGINTSVYGTQFVWW